MNYIKIHNASLCDGEGVRVSLFVSGCPHHCKGCFNKESWDFNCGSLFTKETEDKIIDLLRPSYIKGLTLLGGEPFAQGKDLLPLLKKVKQAYPNKDIWCYTGYLYEEVKDNDMIKYIDVLVDGKFVLELKDATLKFRGSSNQRIIKVN